MFHQIFFSPQVKWCTIITYKHVIYKFPQELPNTLKLRILGNIKKTFKFHKMIAYCPVFRPKWKFCYYLQKTLEKQKLNFFCSILFHMKTRISLRYFVNDCLWKHFLASNSPQTSSNLIYLSILLTLMPFTQF